MLEREGTGISGAGLGKGTPFPSLILPQAPTSKRAAPTTLNSSSQVINNQPLERFDSRGRHLYKFIVAKESVYIRKESNSHKRGLEHTYHQQDSRLSLAHQYPELTMQNGNLKCQL